MFSILFGSGSLSSQKSAISNLQKEVYYLKKENEEIRQLLSEARETITQQQISIGLILTAHQTLSEEMGHAYDVLKSITSPSNPHSFSFTFREAGEDDLDN